MRIHGKPRIAVVVAAILTGVGLGLLALVEIGSGTGPLRQLDRPLMKPVDAEASGQPLIVDDTDAEWMRHLQQGGRVEFRSSPTGPAVAEATVDALGQLTETEIVELTGYMDSTRSLSWNELQALEADAQARTKLDYEARRSTLWMRIAFADECMRSLRDGMYVLTRSGKTAPMAVLRNPYLKHGLQGFGRGDESLRAWILVDRRKAVEYAQAEMRAETETKSLRRYIAASFNGLPEGTRRDLAKRMEQGEEVDAEHQDLMRILKAHNMAPKDGWVRMPQ